MKMLFASFAFGLFVLGSASKAEPPAIPPNAPGVAIGSSACNLQNGASGNNAGVAPRMYCSMDPQFGAFGDAQQTWGHATIASGTNALTVGTAQTISATLTVIGGANTLTASSGVFPSSVTSRNQLVGQPILVPGAGQNGGLYKGVITANPNTTQLGVWPSMPSPLTATSVTITIGNYFSIADIGKAIVVPGAGSAGAALTATITSVSDTNHVTLSTNAVTTLSDAAFNSWQQLVWGHDDSAALNAAVSAAIGRGDRFLYVPGNHYVPSLSPNASYVVEMGEGQFFNSPVRRYVIVPNAPQAAPPSSDMSPVMLSATKAASSPVVAVIGDSIWQNANNPTNAMQAWTYFQSLLTIKNPGKTSWSFYNRAIGGQSFAQADSLPGLFPSWYTNTATPWLGTAAVPGYIYNLTPTTLLIGFQNNDGTNLSIPAFLDMQSKIDSWTAAPDRIFATHWTKSLFNTTGTNSPDAGDYASMFVRTYAKMRGFGVLDFNRQGDRLRDGFDPLANAMVLTPAYNDITNARLNLPYASPVKTTGYSVSLNDVCGCAGPGFWTSYGNEIQFSLSGVSGNLFRMGYDNAADATGRIGSGNLYYQCDIAGAYPGTGCAGGTVPTILTNVSIASGSNSLTTSGGVFKTADNCVWMTVPGAGASGSYLVAYGKYVSATNITLWSDPGCATARNASTTLSASNQAVLRGNPKIQTSINVSSDATTSTKIGMTVAGDTINAFYQSAERQPFISAPAVRFGGPFTPAITSASNFPLGISPFSNLNLAFFMETPALTWPSMTDLEVNGPVVDAPMNNLAYMGLYGGAGDNHPTSLAISRIVRPVLDAAGLAAQ